MSNQPTKSTSILKHVINNDGSHYGYRFYCPGCKESHVIPTSPHPSGWGFNGNEDKPTFTPSILVHSHRVLELDENGNEHYTPRCHSFVTDGRIHFLEDSTHHLTRQILDLEPWEWMMSDQYEKKLEKQFPVWNTLVKRNKDYFVIMVKTEFRNHRAGGISATRNQAIEILNSLREELGPDPKPDNIPVDWKNVSISDESFHLCPKIIQTATDNRLVISTSKGGDYSFFSIERQYLNNGEWQFDRESGIVEHIEHLDEVIRALEACRVR